MTADIIQYNNIHNHLQSNNVELIAVSKTKPVEDIKALYATGHRDFGENYVQEVAEKYEALPKDIRWHFIGHLQSNKVKYIAPFVHLIHGIDSFKLLQEVNKQAKKYNRIIDCLLQVHIASEETKFGVDGDELKELLSSNILPELENIHVKGLMGMASFSDDPNLVRGEFRNLKCVFDKHKIIQLPNCHFTTLSMGMSGDYITAIEEGSTMVRIGSLLFGKREKR